MIENNVTFERFDPTLGMVSKIVVQSNLSSECFYVQVWGTWRCRQCDLQGTEECGGKKVLETYKNEKGFGIPLRDQGLKLASIKVGGEVIFAGFDDKEYEGVVMGKSGGIVTVKYVVEGKLVTTHLDEEGWQRLTLKG